MWLHDLSCLRGAVCCLISKPCSCTSLIIMIAEENAQQPRPFLCTLLFTKMYARRGVINAYCKFFCLILVHSNTFYAFDRVVAIVLNYKVLQLQLPVERGA